MTPGWTPCISSLPSPRSTRGTNGYYYTFCTRRCGASQELYDGDDPPPTGFAKHVALRGTGRYYVVQRQNPRRAGTNGGSMYPAYLGSSFMPGPSLRNLVF